MIPLVKGTQCVYLKKICLKQTSKKIGLAQLCQTRSIRVAQLVIHCAISWKIPVKLTEIQTIQTNNN